MSSASIHPAAATLASVSSRVEKRRSWLASVVHHAIGRWGTRLGIGWIGLVAFCAVFAPFLANSFPLLVKVDGHWSSPAITHLTAVDITLVGTVFSLLVLIRLKKLSWGLRAAWFGGILFVMLLLTPRLIRPALVRGYEEYRDLQQEGRVQWVLRTPIPFSPTDHLTDQFDFTHPQPWAPSRSHWLGTEQNGEDVLSVMIHACRIAMSIGFISTGIAVFIGIIVGGLMGYFAGWVDLLGMRLVEVFGAIPTIYLLLAFCAAFERNIYMVMAIIGLTGWTSDARFVRAEFLRLRGLDFVHAAIAAGLPLRSVLFRHLLPNALAPILVSASFGVAAAILSESVLSFLGLGLPVDAASWGRLLNQSVGQGGGFHLWLAMYPGLAIFLTVFSYNVIGEALRDALDPRLNPQ